MLCNLPAECLGSFERVATPEREGSAEGSLGAASGTCKFAPCWEPELLVCRPAPSGDFDFDPSRRLLAPLAPTGGVRRLLLSVRVGGIVIMVMVMVIMIMMMMAMVR